MAVVTAFEPMELGQPKLHRTRVVCHWSVLRDNNAGLLIQLDTRGSTEREKPEKLSQTLQLTSATAAELVAILRREFGLP